MPRRSKQPTNEYHTFSSTRVDAGWWDAATKTVTLLFPDGTRWAYEGVSRDTWVRFTRAGSAGRFLADVLDHHPNRPA